MYFDYLNVLVFAAVGLVFVFANMVVGSLIRPKRTNPAGLETYECGEPTIGQAWISFDIRYYTVALVYVIFAVEIAFLFPWAVVIQEAFAGTGAAAGHGIGLFALIEGVLFIVILFVGLAYVWAKGDLDWVLSYRDSKYVPRELPAPVLIPSVAELTAAAEPAAPAAHGSEEAA